MCPDLQLLFPLFQQASNVLDSSEFKVSFSNSLDPFKTRAQEVSLAPGQITRVKITSTLTT